MLRWIPLPEAAVTPEAPAATFGHKHRAWGTSDKSSAAEPKSSAVGSCQFNQSILINVFFERVRIQEEEKENEEKPG